MFVSQYQVCTFEDHYIGQPSVLSASTRGVVDVVIGKITDVTVIADVGRVIEVIIPSVAETLGGTYGFGSVAVVAVMADNNGIVGSRALGNLMLTMSLECS